MGMNAYRFRYLLRLRCYKQKSARFEGSSHFQCKFETEGASPTNHCWCQKTRMIALSCGIKISVVHCLVLPQSTRVTDGRTDRQTDSITIPKTALAQLRRAVIINNNHNNNNNLTVCNTQTLRTAISYRQQISKR